MHLSLEIFPSDLDQIQANLIQPVQNGSIQFPRCLRKNEPAFEPVRKSYEEIRNVFGGDSFRENYYDGEAVRMISPDTLFIKSRCFGFWQFCLRIICLR